MICRVCAAPMREDTSFTSDMESINDPRRQFRCFPNGHSVTTDVSVPAALLAPPSRTTPRGAQSRRRPPCIVCGDDMLGEYVTRVRHSRCDAEGRRRYQTIFNQRRKVKRSTAKERGKATGGGVRMAHELAMGGLGR